MEENLNDYSRTCVDVNLDAIRNNVIELKKNLPKKTAVMAVVKADGYGHGDVAVAKALTGICDAYAVATVPEGAGLRANGIKGMILVLGYTFPQEYEQALKYNLDLTVFDYESALLISDTAKKSQVNANVHIKVDTGMRRIGLTPDEDGLSEIKKINSLKNINARGIFTHFAKADFKDKTDARKQYDLFCEFLKLCEKSDISFLYRHCCNSAAAMEMSYAALDMVRLGIAMYGLSPSPEVDMSRYHLEQSITWKARVVMVKRLNKGDCVSYGWTYIAKEPAVIATVAVGYGEGYPRRLSNIGEVLIHGKRARIAGRVCMDQIMVDVTHIPEVERGDSVILTGWDGDEFISVEDVCDKASGGFNYEFVCDIGRRVPRRYFSKGRLEGTHDYDESKWDKLNF